VVRVKRYKLRMRHLFSHLKKLHATHEAHV